MVAQTTSSISIDASPADVLAVIIDVEEYPRWTASVRSVDVLSRDASGRPEQVRFVLDVGPIKDTYVLAYTYTSDTVWWSLVEGSLITSLEGSYVVRPSGHGSEVTYHLSVDVSVPMLGLMKRKAERVIIDTALNELKRRVEGDTE